MREARVRYRMFQRQKKMPERAGAEDFQSFWIWRSGCMVKNRMTVILADGELLKARRMILDFKG